MGRGGAAPDVIRVLVAPGSLEVDRATRLDDDEQHHLRVRRVHAGDNVLAYDGAGAIGRGVVEADGREFEVQVTEVDRHPPPTPMRLAVAAGDRDRYLRLAEQCTELGVTQLFPLVTERSVSVESRIRDTALDKARRRAREACKQSGNPWATPIETFGTLEELAARSVGCSWLLADPGGAPLGDWRPPSDCGWLIGPEGGFTPDELAITRTLLGARSTWLAPHILRFETAAIVAVGQLLDRRAATEGTDR